MPKKVMEYIHQSNKNNTNSAYLHLSRGGLRGLQHLSMTECRNITDTGIAKITELKYLRCLNLLGCVKIEDDSCKSICINFPFLEDLNMASTSISAAGL